MKAPVPFACKSQHTWKRLWLFSMRPRARFKQICVQLYQPNYLFVWGFRQVHFEFWKWPDYCVLLRYSVLYLVYWRLHLQKCSYARNANVICQNCGALKWTARNAQLQHTSASPLQRWELSSFVFCCTDHCCGQAAQYCLMCQLPLESLEQVQPRIWRSERVHFEYFHCKTVCANDIGC